ncbi:MAG TPA: ribonuclease H-like domain-containing protein [Planctomycetota bacterium]|nr:ribonuclease H-like domain-containing protein [Planctomycetota bacterium]
MSQPSLEPDADLPRSALAAAAPERPGLCTYETRFDLSFRHGPWTFHEFARRPLQELAVLLGKRGAEKLSPADAAFVDFEAGSHPRGGSCLFLAGIGRLRDDAFVVTQYLARTPEGERDVLECTARDLAAAPQLVTFNGRSFDVPLLVERTAAEGIEWAPARDHFDLLRMAERLVKRRFADARLVTLERELLRYTRIDDLPGAAAPRAWLELFEEGSDRLLQGVLRHNLLDVLALPALAAELSFRIESPQDLDERENLADARARAGKDRASLERALEDDPDCFRALLEMSKLVEREDGDLDAALDFARRAQDVAEPHLADAARRRIVQLERRLRRRGE